MATILQLVEQILSENAQPMRVQDIYARMQEQGYQGGASNLNNALRSIDGTIIKDVQKGNSRFVRTDPSTWGLTKWISKQPPPPEKLPPPPPPQNVSQLVLQRLTSLDPHGFEIFVGKYLDRKGLAGVQVTGRSHDGGIDGIAQEQFLGVKVAFQAKKYTQSQTVGAAPIRELLGSITNRGADRGIFVTTSSFSPGGKEEAGLSQGKIILIDGERLTQDCIDMELGIKPVTKEATIDEGFFSSLG